MASCFIIKTKEPLANCEAALGIVNLSDYFLAPSRIS